MPNTFSDVPRAAAPAPSTRSLVVASVSPPDRHGYFSLGPNAEYTAALIGEVPFFVEVNAQMPRTFGENQLHVSDVVGWCEADYPLVEVPPRRRRPSATGRIAELVAERIPDGATLQAGIGAVPDMVLAPARATTATSASTPSCSATASSTSSSRGVITGTRKATHRNKMITTSALGTSRLYDFVADNAGRRVLAGRLHQRPAHHRAASRR